MLWIALYLPALPLQVFAQTQPESRLLAVTAGPCSKELIAVSVRAEKLGISAGMRASEALTLAPELCLHTREPDKEQALLEDLTNWVASFTSLISIDPEHGVLLEVSQSLKLFGGLDGLLNRLRNALQQLSLQIQLAVAPTPLGARWLACARPDTIATGSSGWVRMLDHLPLKLLLDEVAATPALRSWLQGIGIHTLAALEQLPRDGLARRHASHLVKTLHRATGQHPDPRRWHSPPLTYHCSATLPNPTSLSGAVLLVIDDLLTGLIEWLNHHLLAVSRISLQLHHFRKTDTALEIRTSAATWRQASLRELISAHLESLQLTAPVEAITLDVSETCSRPESNGDLFGHGPLLTEQASQLPAQLAARLGKHAVFCLRAVSEHRPEQAWRKATPGSTSNRRPGQSGGRRPLWLLAAPRKLESLEGLTLLKGPERIESGWWDNNEIRRDYYIAQTHHHSLWWIFNSQNEAKGWYIHGFFG